MALLVQNEIWIRLTLYGISEKWNNINKYKENLEIVYANTYEKHLFLLRNNLRIQLGEFLSSCWSIFKITNNCRKF